MPYKDESKAREATKERTRRYRERIKDDVTPSVVVTPLGVGNHVTPSDNVTPVVTPSLVTHPDVIKAANELPPHRFSYLGAYYYWNAGTVQEQLRALPPASRIRWEPTIRDNISQRAREQKAIGLL